MGIRDPNLPESGKDDKTLVKIANTEDDQDKEPLQNFSLRETMAKTMHCFSDFVNENLIAARYATVSTVILLGAYSLSQTPLFFHYRNLQQIPLSVTKRRKLLNCRLIQVQTSNKNDYLTCYVRHLSPMETLLSQSQFEMWTRIDPSNITANDTNDDTDLLCLQLFAVRLDGNYSNTNYLQSLARKRTFVRCQLLFTDENFAIARLYLYSFDRLMFIPQRIDLGAELVKSGQVRLDHSVASMDTSRNDRQNNDSKYFQHLSKMEHSAILDYRGMWKSPELRKVESELVEKVEWESKAKWYHKLWRRFWHQ